MKIKAFYPQPKSREPIFCFSLIKISNLPLVITLSLIATAFNTPTFGQQDPFVLVSVRTNETVSLTICTQAGLPFDAIDGCSIRSGQLFNPADLEFVVRTPAIQAGPGAVSEFDYSFSNSSPPSELKVFLEEASAYASNQPVQASELTLIPPESGVSTPSYCC